MTPIRLTAALHLLAKAGRQRRFKIVAYRGGELSVDEFPHPVIVDLQGLTANGTIPILLDHQASTETTLGSASEIVNDGRSLTLAGPVTGTSPQVQQVLSASDAGHKWGASVGCRVIDQQEIPPGETVAVNGQTFRGPIIVARRAELLETSVLPVAADRQTSVNLAARAAKENTMPSFEQWLAEMAVDPARLSEAAQAALMSAYDEEMNPPDPGAEPVPAVPAEAAALINLRGTVATENRRIAAIQAVAASHPLICATAVESNWTPAETEIAILRANAKMHAPSNHRGHVDAIRENDPAVLSASLMLRAGHESLAVKSFGEQTVDAARRQKITNLVDLAGASLRAAGRSPDDYSNRDQMLRAAFSTQSLPNILSDVVARTLVGAYEETTSDWKRFCYIASADDFRQQTGIRPAAIAGLDQLGDGGKIKHGNIAEEATYNWSVLTYAKMISITRTTIINDDLAFASALSPMLGQAAGRSLNDLIWSTIMGGETAGFFSSGNSNLLASSSALAVGSLGVAVAAMRSQTDSQGFDLAIPPAALVVPPGLELTARNLLNSAYLVGSTTSNALLPSGNPVQGIVPNLVVEPRLANARFTGYDVDAWYLFGGPNTRPVTVGFLQSQQSPTVEIDDGNRSHLERGWVSNSSFHRWRFLRHLLHVAATNRTADF